jgi:hypothetical protein
MIRHNRHPVDGDGDAEQQAHDSGKTNFNLSHSKGGLEQHSLACGRGDCPSVNRFLERYAVYGL